MAPFTGLEARFNANVKALYSYRSPRDKGDGSLGLEPFIISSPLSFRDVGGDTRFLPVQSTINDVSRLGGFLKSPEGLLFLGEQAVMQTGTVFTETRVLNPLFVIGNAVPFLHLTRPLAVASDFTPSGDITQKSPASDSTLGSAGRLQMQTAADAVSRAMNTGGGSSGLLGLLNPVQILQNISGLFSLVTGGPEGINERPEFDVGNGTMYSVALWEGFQKQPWALSPLNDAAANLRKGNILGAAINLAQTVANVVTGFPASLLPPELNLNPSTERGNTSPWEDGKRYFITDDQNADRYLKNTVVFGATPDGTAYPVANMAFMYRTAYSLPAVSLDSVVPPTDAPVSSLPSTQNFTTTSGFNSFVDSQVNSVTSFASNAVKSIRLPIAVPGLPSFNNPIPAVIPSPLSSNNAASDNPAEDDMLFPDLALRNRYQNDERLTQLRQALQDQMNSSFAYWKAQKATIPNGLGFDEGDGDIGSSNDRDPTVRSGDQFNLIDKLNWIDITKFGQGKGNDTQVPTDYINILRKTYGQDLINVFFYDYVNKQTIPFRAFITNINETVTPEYTDTRYIGRLERNVIYVGVQRQLTFTLKVYAMSKEEMEGIWKKINYMTGLCYPAQYSQGFMVPPLVKLTVGDFYRDQPGYMRALSHTIEDDTSWETTDGQQAPMGISMNITFAVLEKKLMKSASTFYPFGIPRDPTQPTAITAHTPDTSINTSVLPSIPNPPSINIPTPPVPKLPIP